MPAAESTSEGALRELSTLLIAKDLFLTDWYEEAASRLAPVERRLLFERIRRETREERDATLPLLRRWVELTGGSGSSPPGADEIARLTRHEFVHTLIEAKEAAGEVYERAAAVAPRALRGEFLALAAIDFRHAVDLRRLLLDVIEAESRGLREEAFPQGEGGLRGAGR